MYLCIKNTHLSCTRTNTHTHSHTCKDSYFTLLHTHIQCTHYATHTHAHFVDVRSSKVMKTSTLSPAQDEKDYFQVTDELAKENSHFAMSEALLTVVEQVSYS